MSVKMRMARLGLPGVQILLGAAYLVIAVAKPVSWWTLMYVLLAVLWGAVGVLEVVRLRFDRGFFQHEIDVQLRMANQLMEARLQNEALEHLVKSLKADRVFLMGLNAENAERLGVES